MVRPSREEILALLQQVPLFSALTRADLERLLAEARLQTASAGTELVSPGVPAERFYVILSGRVNVFQLSSKGDQQILHAYGAGATFGEAAMWKGVAYPAYAEALEPTTLLVIERETLASAIRRRPELALGMLAGLSGKLAEFTRLIESLALKEVPARLAAVLLDLAAEAGAAEFDLPQSKRDLAARIGTIPETLSRALGRLRRADCIDVEGRRIRILDAGSLREIAES
jgi:CRP/FNR family transcriptional regulator